MKELKYHKNMSFDEYDEYEEQEIRKAWDGIISYTHMAGGGSDMGIFNVEFLKDVPRFNKKKGDKFYYIGLDSRKPYIWFQKKRKIFQRRY